jgi:hypothetical protein
MKPKTEVELMSMSTKEFREYVQNTSNFEVDCEEDETPVFDTVSMLRES